MSDYINEAVAAMNAKMPSGFDGSAKFDVTGEGSFVLDQDGARVDDSGADVTLSADVDTFRGIIDGDIDPTSAFMSGKLAIDGDMGVAMRLAQALA
ncbi:SCP2 sterol-binding domain-containing protein [Puniceibacterium sp. IMCC21224]|uniref:SCP2 sterol-binding domain-containing protein n=1 Tax=Puniceibacterium sp. IMCC21224 TaxID=1618204 RepID=UPI00064DF6F2|nr:SCP2 sterol-binding domain-containing protein [Puniceibacterium sp. IMCC21224]KMK67791.1 SCP-2 sterol transfer family protein [Puniceibacterium sp. IMCC21224]